MPLGTLDLNTVNNKANKSNGSTAKQAGKSASGKENQTAGSLVRGSYTKAVHKILSRHNTPRDSRRPTLGGNTTPREIDPAALTAELMKLANAEVSQEPSKRPSIATTDQKRTSNQTPSTPPRKIKATPENGVFTPEKKAFSRVFTPAKTTRANPKQRKKYIKKRVSQATGLDLDTLATSKLLGADDKRIVRKELGKRKLNASIPGFTANRFPDELLDTLEDTPRISQADLDRKNSSISVANSSSRSNSVGSDTSTTKDPSEVDRTSAGLSESLLSNEKDLVTANNQKDESILQIARALKRSDELHESDENKRNTMPDDKINALLRTLDPDASSIESGASSNYPTLPPTPLETPAATPPATPIKLSGPKTPVVTKPDVPKLILSELRPAPTVPSTPADLANATPARQEKPPAIPAPLGTPDTKAPTPPPPLEKPISGRSALRKKVLKKQTIAKQDAATPEAQKNSTKKHFLKGVRKKLFATPTAPQEKTTKRHRRRKASKTQELTTVKATGVVPVEGVKAKPQRRRHTTRHSSTRSHHKHRSSHHRHRNGEIRHKKRHSTDRRRHHRRHRHRRNHINSVSQGMITAHHTPKSANNLSLFNGRRTSIFATPTKQFQHVALFRTPEPRSHSDFGVRASRSRSRTTVTPIKPRSSSRYSSPYRRVHSPNRVARLSAKLEKISAEIQKIRTEYEKAFSSPSR